MLINLNKCNSQTWMFYRQPTLRVLLYSQDTCILTLISSVQMALTLVHTMKNQWNKSKKLNFKGYIYIYIYVARQAYNNNTTPYVLWGYTRLYICHHPMPCSIYTYSPCFSEYTVLVSLSFGTAIPTYFNILLLCNMFIQLELLLHFYCVV